MEEVRRGNLWEMRELRGSDGTRPWEPKVLLNERIPFPEQFRYGKNLNGEMVDLKEEWAKFPVNIFFYDSFLLS